MAVADRKTETQLVQEADREEGEAGDEKSEEELKEGLREGSKDGLKDPERFRKKEKVGEGPRSRVEEWRSGWTRKRGKRW